MMIKRIQIAITIWLMKWLDDLADEFGSLADAHQEIEEACDPLDYDTLCKWERQFKRREWAYHLCSRVINLFFDPWEIQQQLYSDEYAQEIENGS